MSVDITGKKFGKLKVINRVHRDNTKNSYYLCECEECGNMVEVARTSLVSGKSTNCGCVRRKLFSEETRFKAGFIDHTCVSILKSKLSKKNSSGIKGVTWDKSRNKWLAQICFKGTNYYLGRYTNKIDAKKARKRAEEQTHDKFIKWYENEYKGK